MSGYKIKKGDKVIVNAGNQKGKTGKVERVLPKSGKAIIKGVNVRKKHKKPTNELPNGGVFEEEMPIDISNLSIENPTKKGKTTRVGYKIDAKGNKKRVYKSNDKEIK